MNSVSQTGQAGTDSARKDLVEQALNDWLLKNGDLCSSDSPSIKTVAEMLAALFDGPQAQVDNIAKVVEQ